VNEIPASAIAWHFRPFIPEPADPDPLVAAILDGIAYRLVLTQALAALHDRHRRYDLLRAEHQRLDEAYRDLRARVVEATR
jgi:hypothetical protein